MEAVKGSTAEEKATERRTQRYSALVDVMNENDSAKVTSISGARTPEEIGEFWVSQSLDDYWDETHEVEFEVRAKRRCRVTLDPEVYAELEAEARTRGVLPETLVSLWLAERLHSQNRNQIRMTSS